MRQREKFEKEKKIQDQRIDQSSEEVKLKEKAPNTVRRNRQT